MGKIVRLLKESEIGNKILKDPFFRSLITTSFSMGWNLVYAVFNGVLGIYYRSYWFVSLFAYYLMLGLMRGYVVVGRRKNKPSDSSMYRICGVGMILLAVILSGITCMGIAEDHATKYHMIVMIAIAAFTFYLAVIAIVSAIKAHHKTNIALKLLRDISLVSTIGSMMSLERSMLGTFGDSREAFSITMEAASGAVSFVMVLLVAVSMLTKSCKPNK